ncbi:hypothetical protein [Bacillus sp. FJAT-45037]|uniref:hypothetical protein n=1 Tax=Bacillus sp. FJAT-45037 TaxID=2011007 RepID=UPI000C234D66|nr:hypothetical protein [Bacillus sp. FJAT-45037]
MEKPTFSEQVKHFTTTLENSKGKKVRYRVEESPDYPEYKNDSVVNVIVSGNDITVDMQQTSVTTNEVKQISYTDYPDRTDFWLYGKDSADRYNVTK